MLAPRGVLVTLAVLTVAAVGCAGERGAPAQGSQGGSPAAARATAPAQAAGAGGVRLVGVGRFASPVYVTAPPKDRRRAFVVEQGGTIRVVRGGRKLSRPFLDIRRLVLGGGEQGLLSMAFSPDYARTGRFYVYYTDKAGQQRIVEYRRRGADVANPGSARLVLRMRDPEPNHNGGLLSFGPDGMLYVGTGDGGGADDQHGPRGNAQNLGSLLGKLLRIDPRRSGTRPYRVPSSNPFVGRSGARPEIWSYGLRNPWRFSFDAANGNLSMGDVGQNEVEEINYVKGTGKGANFGWRPFEGTRVNFSGEPAPGAITPVLEKTHDGDGWCSVTGGYVVRDPGLPALRGRYVFGDFCEGRVRVAKLAPGRVTGERRLNLKRVESLSSFGQDARKRVYVVSLDGPVYRLAAR